MFPAELGQNISLLLIATSAATSFLAAASGIGGGIVLLALMAMVMPAHALIPVHGMVQFGSNTGRAVLLARHMDLRVLLPFAAGSVVGAALGGFMAVQLPAGWLHIGLGCFILFAVWGPAVRAAGHAAVAVTGLVSSFLTMFFGATGTFVAAMVKTLKLGRMEHVATHSICMSVQHVIKVITFGLLGFAYGPYIGLIVAMIASGFIGTVLGKRVLMKSNDKLFHKVLAGVLTVLALRLFYQGAQTLL